MQKMRGNTKMIVAIDIETQGLNAKKYITGCLIKQGKKKPEIYRSSKDLWNRVIELGLKEAKRGKILNVYSHNAKFDTAGYIDLTDKHMTFFSNSPLIWSYRISKKEGEKLGIKIEKSSKEIIKFLDTLSIYRMTLKEVGEIIQLPKIDTPEELLKEQETGQLTEKKLQEIETYMIRDTEIVMKAILDLKTKLKEDGVEIKRLYTINQIAIQYVITKLRKLPRKENEGIILNPETGMTWYGQEYKSEKQEELMTDYFTDMHSAYRGGRVEAFKTGLIKDNVYYIDQNSQYGWVLSQMKIPDLRSEKKTWKPLQGLTSPESKKQMVKAILKTIGISRVMIKNENNNIGILPVRTDIGNYYPRKGKYQIGTYTHLELRKALKEGYKLLDIEWTMTWKELPNNPFKKVYEELYRKRITNNKFDYFFYKAIMNNSIGKMAQTRTNQEIVVDSVELAEEYLKKNYEIIKGVNTNYMYKTELEQKNHRKPYYMPIISALVTAHARIHMYEQYKKIPLKDLLYTDTDSVIMLNNHLAKFNIKKGRLGQFKTEAENESANIYGRKTYRVGEKMKIAGFKQRHITAKDFDKGYIESQRMISIHTSKDLKDVGTFETIGRDLQEQKDKYEEATEKLGELPLYLDKDIKSFKFFLQHIKMVGNTS